MIKDEIAALLDRALDTAGLFPEPTPGVVLGEGERAEVARLVEPRADLVARPPRAWPARLLELWARGAVYLRDEPSRVSPRADLDVTRLVVRATVIGPFCRVAGDLLLLDQSLIEGHDTVEGPAAIVASRVQSHVVVGPMVIVLRSGVMPFTKIQRFVRVDGAAIGSSTAIEGGTHPEKIPLGPKHRTFGATIAAGCWIGQHVSISAGAVIGEGVTVAPFTSVTRPIPEHVLVTGTPARIVPIDANIRGLTPAQAREEGRLQGHSAMRLPVYGPARAAFARAEVVEVDYPRHGVLRGLASDNLLQFQRGVLESTLGLLFPDHHAEVRVERGASVRFTLTFDRPLLRHVAPAPDVLVERRDGASGELAPADAELLARIGPAGTRLGELAGEEAGLQRLAAAGWIQPTLFRAAGGLTPAAMARLWRTFATWSAEPLAPLAPAAPEPSPPATDAVPAPAPAPPSTDAGSTRVVISELLRSALPPGTPVDDDIPFYALGLDSMAVTAIAARLEERFGIAPPDLFTHNTVATLTEALDACLRQ